MKNRALLILSIFSYYVWAMPVSLTESHNVAINWMYEKTGKTYVVDDIYKRSLSSIDAKSYRIIYLKPSAWVIVSSDNIAKPIIGYGTSIINEDNLPPEFQNWMKQIDIQIQSVKKINSLRTTKTSSEWKRLTQNTHLFKTKHKLRSVSDSNYVVSPLLWMGGNSEADGILWGQEGYAPYYEYNKYAPYDSEVGFKVPIGCVAVAMGQIMRYYQLPLQGTGSHSYTPNLHPEYGEQSADFGTTIYDWENMSMELDKSSTEIETNSVATLLYHSAVSVNMDFSPDASWATDLSAADAFKNFFGYDIASSIYRIDSDTVWHNLIQEQLDASRPVYYSGDNSNGDYGHAFIIDGYDADNFYHINWGWYGSVNGKFTLDNLTPDYDYSYSQGMIALLANDDSPTLTIDDPNIEACVMNQLGISDKVDLTQAKARYLTTLNCYNMEISDISELLKFPLLSDLRVNSNNITDISPLSHLTNLKILMIYHNHIDDFSSINNLIANGLTIFGKENQIPIYDTFESNNNFNTAKIKIEGESVHSISYVGDQDWYKFILNNRSEIDIETNGIAKDTIIELYNSKEELIAFDDNSGNNLFSKIIFTLNKGTYYFKISENADDETINQYSLKLTISPKQDISYIYYLLL